MQYEYRDTFVYNGKRYDVKAHTQRELRRKMDARRAKAMQEEPEVTSSMTVQSWGLLAIEKYKTNQKEVTRKKYMSRVQHCIFDEIGHMRMVDVRPIDCQSVLNLQQGKSKTQINEVHGALVFIFETAVANGLLRSNPAGHLQKPAGTRPSRRALTDEERETVRKVIPKKRKYMLFRLMLDCGLRPSEAAECKGGDIVLRGDAALLHVRGTKTGFSDRFVPLPMDLYNEIKSTPKSAYIASYDGGGKITEGNRNRVWQAFRRDMNIEMGAKIYRNQLQEDLVAPDLVPYCLRHDYCTRLAKSDIDIRTAQRIMGHSDISTTANIYTHVDDGAIEDVARKLSK